MDHSSWDCTAAPVAGGAGADPYWRNWTFDLVGNRLTQVDHGATAGTDTNWTYTLPTAGATRPHTLTSVAASGPLAGTPTRAFAYDNAGNTLTRQSETGANQDLAWDKEGHLEKLVEGTNTTSYLYDADGNRLISRAPTKTTLYLGGTELELPAAGGSVLGTRYYSAAGTTVAVRNAGGLTWTCADHHGTQQVQINAGTLAASRQRSMPYGETRGTQPVFVGTKGYVGGTKDDTA